MDSSIGCAVSGGTIDAGRGLKARCHRHLHSVRKDGSGMSSGGSPQRQPGQHGVFTRPGFARAS
eukprot:scaffold1390_cov249-Pinguiococcus_pyrenoidosus.AAC.3